MEHGWGMEWSAIAGAWVGCGQGVEHDIGCVVRHGQGGELDIGCVGSASERMRLQRLPQLEDSHTRENKISRMSILASLRSVGFSGPRLDPVFPGLVAPSALKTTLQ